MKKKKKAASYHDRRLVRRLEHDPEFQAEFERFQRAASRKPRPHPG